VAGDARNIKITGAADLEFAEAMIALEKARRPDR
jgi:2-C-methyl-D-erythritol 4-phosphate cytidylyltransferase